MPNVKIFNSTKNKLISEKAEMPKGVFAQSVGLIGARKARPMVLRTRFGIHTFGLKFPIDVLILDKTGRVAVVKENLEAFRVFVWKPVYDTVIELPAGTIKKTKTSVKDVIRLDKI